MARLPMPARTLRVHVDFSYRGQSWGHDFQVPEGGTVLRLKELMLRGTGTRADVASFELQRGGSRIPDYETVAENMSVSFAFVGPEEGARRTTGDEEASKRSFGELWAQAGSAEVGITVRHAVEEMQSEIVVQVPKDGTVLDVRKAVMAALGESKLSEVKLVKRAGSALTTLPNDAKIGDQREFLSMGRRLLPVAAGGTGAGATATRSGAGAGVVPSTPAAAAADAVVKLTVTSAADRATTTVELPGDRTVLDLKAKLCEGARRGTAGDVSLLLASGKELADADRLSSVPGPSRGSVELRGIGLGPPRRVEVTVVHASSGRQAQVGTLDTSTMLELKRAVSDQLGASSADIRIVEKRAHAGAGWETALDSERLNGRTQLYCFCKPLEAAPEPVFEDKELAITVTLDRSLDLSQEITLKKGSTLYSLKELLAEGDPTGSTKPGDFGLCLASAPTTVLPDDLRLTEEHLQLEILQSD